MNRQKMVWILLLIDLTSFVCGVFGVKVSPTVYQTEEDDNVTIRWDTQTKTDLSLTNLYCFLQSETFKVLYQMINGVEDPESQHQQFAGRVQLDRDALREGRVRLHLSTVTAEDSGNYWCDLAVNYDNDKRRWGLMATVHFVLNVTQNSHGEIRVVSSAAAGPRHVLGESQLGDMWTVASALTSVVGAAALLGFLVVKVFPRSKTNNEDEIKKHLIELLLEINTQRELHNIESFV